MPYHHSFSDEELDQMLYGWDAQQHSVKEYFYMKEDWKQPSATQETDQAIHGAIKGGTSGVISLQDQAIDTGTRTKLNSTFAANNSDDITVYLDLDTTDSIHVVEFYAPWCPHCVHMRDSYIEMAAEVSRRAIGVRVHFHAVSCQLFPMICRAYQIAGFPVILGYSVGSNITARGIELNPDTDDAPELSVQSIAESLHLTLAAEVVDSSHKQDSNFTQLDWELTQKELSQAAIDTKLAWHTYASSVDERYHNAAVSLVFVLKNGLYTTDQATALSQRQASTLKDFLQLIDWATPQAWHIRTGLVRDLLANISSICQSRQSMIRVIDMHLAQDAGDDLWGGLSPRMPTNYNTLDKTNIHKNSKWTEACSHAQRGMGYTCGLWNICHILTVGSSFPTHYLYGFYSGYTTSPADAAEIISKFIVSFFACDVCRKNYWNNYESCGQNHCSRLTTVMPVLDTSNEDANLELTKWFLEMHNEVNERIMRETAQRQGRNATVEEQRAAVFPTRSQCPTCWLDSTTLGYNCKETVTFVQDWYWPTVEHRDDQFQGILRRSLRSRTSLKHHKVHGFTGYGGSMPKQLWAFPIVVVIVLATLRYNCRRHHLKRT